MNPGTSLSSLDEKKDWDADRHQDSGIESGGNRQGVGQRCVSLTIGLKFFGTVGSNMREPYEYR